MKKITLIVLTLLIVLVALSAYFLRDEPLTPLAEKALHYQAAPVPAEQNAFVGLAGFTAPAGSDFIQAGKDAIRDGSLVREAKPDEQKLAFSANRYSYSCAREIAENCLNEIRSDAENIQKLLQENHELVQRYLKVQEMPVYSYTDMSKTQIYLSIHYHEAINISRLLSAKAVLDIKNGNIAQGLNWIKQDLDFQRRILAAKDTILVEQVIAVAQVRRYAVLLSLLISENDLSGQEASLRALLAPLDSPKEYFKNAMWGEQVLISNTILNARPNDLLEQFCDDQCEEQGYLERLSTYFKRDFLYKPSMTLNLMLEVWAHEMEIVNATPPSRLPSVNARQKALERAGCTNVKYLFCKSPKNFLGEVLVLMSNSVNYTDYLLSIYDTDAYLHLVRTQMEYKLAARQADADPAKILATLPPETFNPYTDAPFDWDGARGVIGFQPAASREKDKRVEIRLHPQEHAKE
jgi:hypothetical protein